MPALDEAYGPPTTDRSSPAGATDAEVDRAGTYLTNEVFLYRVVGHVASARENLVELEDCYSLDVVHVPVRDLRDGRLRVVMLEPASG